MDVERGTEPASYEHILGEYLRTRGEAELYRASTLSRRLIERGMGPEDIIALHAECVSRMLPSFAPIEQARAMGDSHQFLLEVMIAYGIRFREYLELRVTETQRAAEARLEQERTRALRAEQNDERKDDLLALIAHELRSPLTAALGNLDVATRAVTRGQLEPLPPLLQSARDALDRLSRLTADLVEVSRNEPHDLPREPVLLDRLIEQCHDWVAPTAGEKRLQVDYVRPVDPVYVFGNPDALLSILGNLLANAVRYTGSGGSVTVRWNRDPGGATAWVEVRDTGIGIAPETRARIFEKFYRAPQAEAVEPRGLGLGLALVRQLVLAHAGSIDVESVVGAGSVFRVRLPAADHAA